MRKLYAKVSLVLTLLLSSFIGFSQVSVTATAGTAGPTTYTTLAAAFNAINAGTHHGVITVSITGNTTETAMDSLVSSGTGAAAYTSVLIKPAVGATPTIFSTVATTIKLRGADNVTIDGSNTAGGTTRDLTLMDTATSGLVLWIASNNASDGATNNVIKNCIIRGRSSSTATIGGILTGGGNALGADADAPNSNNTVSNNAIYAAQNAMYVRGNTTNLDQNWVIDNNDLGSTVAADKPSYRGILIGNSQGYTIKNNRIFGIVSTATSTATTTGIQLALNHNGGTIYNNKISDIKQTNTGGYGCNGINLSAATTASNVTVYNNFISDVAGYGYNDVTVADNGYGIFIGAGGGYNIYFNTVNLNTSQTDATGHQIALNITSAVTTANSINLKNNILVVTSTVGDRLAIYSGAPTTVFASIDYNDYYSTGANLAYVGGSNRADLAALQAGFGSNVNSLSVLPGFVSATDLHITPSVANLAIANKGTPIAGITLDIDGQTRVATAPDMGADEFSEVTVGTLGSLSACAGSTISIPYTAAFTFNAGNVFTAQLSDASGSFASPVTLGTATATTSGTITGTIPANTPGGSGYRIRIISSNQATVNSDNGANITVNAPPSGTIAYSGSPYCTNGTTASVTQTGTTGGTFTSTSGLSINSTTGAINLAGSTAGTYTVTYTVAPAGGCSQFTTTATVTISQGASSTIAYSGSPFCTGSAAGNVTQTGTTGGTYSSTTGLTINTTTGAVTPGTSTPGTYTVTYTIPANNGCAQYTTTATVVVNATPAQPTITQVGNNLQSSAASGNQWYLNGTLQPAFTTQTITPIQSGNYTVQVTSNGCTSTMSSAFNYTLTAVSSVDLSKYIIIAPNPVKQMLNVNCTGYTGSMSIRVTDASGKEVIKSSRFTSTYKYDMSSYQAGIYIVEVINERTGDKFQKKITKL